MTLKPYTVGDRFNLLEEDIHGIITDIMCDGVTVEPYALEIGRASCRERVSDYV